MRLVDRAFFVRYSDNGPHVRLRMLAATSLIANEVRSALSEHVRRISPGCRIEGKVSVPMPQTLPVAALRWVPYVPEVARYGGAAALASAEAFFDVSSDAAIAILDEVRAESRALRMGRCLTAMLCIAHAFCDAATDAVGLFERYAGGYSLALSLQDPRKAAVLTGQYLLKLDGQLGHVSPLVRACWERLGGAESLSAPLDRLRDGARSMSDAFNALEMAGGLASHLVNASGLGSITSALCGQIHMTSNRLGITIGEECLLALACANALRQGC